MGSGLEAEGRTDNGEDAQDAAVKADEVEPRRWYRMVTMELLHLKWPRTASCSSTHGNGPTADAKEGQEGSAGVEEAGIKTSEDASNGGGAAPDEVKIDSEGICQVLSICIIDDSD